MAKSKTEDISGLSVRQELALRELSRGKGVAEAARAVGVNRATLFRWLREPQFVAALNRWRAAATVLARGQLYAAAGDAAKVLTKAACRGDLRAAAVLLKGLGILAQDSDGSDDPRVIAREQILAERSQELKLNQTADALREAEAMVDTYDLERIESDLNSDGSLEIADPEADAPIDAIAPAAPVPPSTPKPSVSPAPPTPPPPPSPARPEQTQAEPKSADGMPSAFSEAGRIANREWAEQQLKKEQMGFHERKQAGDPAFND
jgi:hypothetical protein